MNDWAGRRVLVTGAAGFIGANLVRALLDRGAEVHGLVRPDGDVWRLRDLPASLTLQAASIADRARMAGVVAACAPDLVFHLAARGVLHAEQRDPETLVANLLGTACVLEACAARGDLRVVHLGGASEYGKHAGPLCEDDRADPATFYGVTKACATLLARQLARERGLRLTILRPFSVYGPWEARRRFVPSLIAAALDGKELALTPAGLRRDFVHVADVVDACLAAGQRDLPPGEIVNVGSGDEHSNEEVVRLLEEVSGLRVRTRPGAFPPRAADSAHRLASTDKARALLGWTPRHDLASGLRMTFDWWAARAVRAR